MILELRDVLPFALGVDNVRPDQALVGFLVNHAVGVGAIVHVDAFRLEVSVNPILGRGRCRVLFLCEL